VRRLADAERIHRFMRALSREAESESRIYFTGGTTAVLFGWRDSTVDRYLALDPRTFRASVEELFGPLG